MDGLKTAYNILHDMVYNASGGREQIEEAILLLEGVLLEYPNE